MPRAVPVRSQNAIDEISFTVRLRDSLDDKTLVRLMGLETELEEDFETFNILKAIELRPPSEAPSMPIERQAGVFASKASSTLEGRLQWSLRAESNIVTCACSEYTSWPEVSEKAIRYLSSALDKYDIGTNPVVEFVFECADKFTLEGSEEDYSISLAFNPNSKYLSQFVREQDESAWHIYQGWWEGNSTAPLRMLNNLNLNAFNDGKVHQTVVKHSVRVMAKQAINGQSVSELFSSSGFLGDSMQLTHESNKSVLLDLLSKEVIDSISLDN